MDVLFMKKKENKKILVTFLGYTDNRKKGLI